MKDYLGLQSNESFDYDVALIDIDCSRVFNDFGMETAEKDYFVTSFDLFSLKKGLEILSGIDYEIYMKKILFSKTMSKEEDEYLNYLSREYPVSWEEDKIYFPYELGDQSVIIEGQRSAKIKFRGLSGQYKDSLLAIVEEIVGNVSYGELKRVMRNIEKGE